MAAQIGQPHARREPVDDQRLGRARQHGLTAVGQIPQPCGAVDGRAGVVAVIAQLNLARVHPDAQPDRCQRRPLQLQRAGHRIRRPCERHHETVALTLLDRAHTIVGGDDLRHRLIQTSDGHGHLAGLGLPQPRRTLHVSQQQRHRARRQKPAHAKIAPVHQRCIRARIDVAHASQHAATTCGKTSAQTRRLQPIARVSMTPERADLSRPKHNQSQATTDQQPRANSRQPGATST